MKSPREKRQQREKALAIGLGTVAIIVVVAFVALFVTTRERPLGQDMCPTEGLPEAYWAVIIDVTDQYNPTQQRWIGNQFRVIKDSIPQYGRLAVFTVPENPEELVTPMVTLCNPGTGKNVSRATGNPKLLQKRWEEEFDQPMNKILAKLLRDPASKSSPIMETIQQVNLGSFPYSSVKRCLFIFSDMMQHSSSYSHYTSPSASFASFEQSNEYRRVRTDLSGWDVTIYYAGRGLPVQGRTHARFWEQYVLSMNGIVSRVKKIEGR